MVFESGYDPLDPGASLFQNGFRLLESSRSGGRYQIDPDDFCTAEWLDIFKLVWVVPDDFGAADDGLLGGQGRKSFLDGLPQLLFGNGGDCGSTMIVSR